MSSILDIVHLLNECIELRVKPERGGWVRVIIEFIRIRLFLAAAPAAVGGRTAVHLSGSGRFVVV